MTTPFLRLLKSDDKEAALSSSVASLRNGTPDPATVFSLDPAKFSKVPNSPFAYWVVDEIRDLFTKFPPFESEGRTVKQGLATADDFRFVRAWWEVPAERRLDSGNGPDWRTDLPAFQAWCRKRTYEGKYWAPFAKGGEYSPYYSDIHLVVNWSDEGEEIKNNRNEKGGIRSNVWMLKDTEKQYFFRPGVTWPLRAHTFCPQILPSGTVFSVRGYSFFDKPENLLYDIGMTATRFFDALFKTLLGRAGYPEFIVGILQVLPYPSKRSSVLQNKAYQDYIEARALSCSDESQLYFSGKCRTASTNACISISSVDMAVSGDYSLQSDIAADLIEILNINDPTETIDDEESRQQAETCSLDYNIGLAMGRFDIRIARDSSLVAALPDPFELLPVCPPAMLVGTDGLPARADNITSEAWLRARPNAISLPPEPVRSKKISAAEYPLYIPWDGIIVDDPEDERDILTRLRAVLTYLYGVEAEAKEHEFCAELEVRDLRDYLRKPSLFFDSHLKRYSKSRRKAPIYLPLQTCDGRYTIWLYYPRLTADTLYGCSNILEAKLKLERRKLEIARADLDKSQGKTERARVEELSDFVAALTEMKEEIERVAGLPYKPDLDDGVQITASPLWSLFRLPSWQKELKATWEKLENGDYDWAHLAYTIWPERVREKCRKDRSLAIAHGQEDICEQKVPVTEAAGKKRGRKVARPTPDEAYGLDIDE